MKLNYECLRKVLFALEEFLDLKDDLNFKTMTVKEITDIPILTNNFSRKDIAYCVYMLADAKLITYTKSRNLVDNDGFFYGTTDSYVSSLTYKGHEFLQQIQNETIWSRTKEKLKPLGIMTIDIISQVASNVITSALNSRLGYPQD